VFNYPVTVGIAGTVGSGLFGVTALSIFQALFSRIKVKDIGTGIDVEVPRSDIVSVMVTVPLAVEPF